MRNFEKNFDRLIDSLKESTEILKECNKEMTNLLSGTKTIYYVIADKDRNNFYNSNYNIFLSGVGGATLYKTTNLAKSIIEEYGINEEDFEIVPVSVKVVETC